MATSNIVPRSNNEGSIGTSIKQWENVYAKDFIVDGNSLKAKLDDLSQANDGYSKTETDTLLNGKLNINLGMGNANKVLIVGQDGNVSAQNFSAVPTGAILPFASNGNLPAGFLLCNGASVSKVTYADLFNAIGYTFGGSGDNFNLPNLNDNRFLEGSESAGQSKEAGLPNITGTIGYVGLINYVEDSGAFYKGWTQGGGNFGSGEQRGQWEFDASRCSDVYGNADTVQPKSLTVRYIIKAFAGASPSSSDVAITNVANDVNTLASKTDIVLENEWDGDYCIRYANGLQICRGTFTINLGSGASSGYFYGAYFLQPFLATPTILCTPNGAYGEFLTVHTQDSSNTSLEGYYKMNSSSHNNDTSVSWVAIGKWK